MRTKSTRVVHQRGTTYIARRGSVNTRAWHPRRHTAHTSSPRRFLASEMDRRLGEHRVSVSVSVSVNDRGCALQRDHRDCRLPRDRALCMEHRHACVRAPPWFGGGCGWVFNTFLFQQDDFRDFYTC